MVLSINEAFLKTMIAVLILVVIAIMLFNREIGTHAGKKATTSKKYLGCLLTFVSIFAFTFVGGGTGIVLSYILIFLFGETFIQSMGTRKVVTSTAVFFSAGFFILSGVVMYEIAVPLLITGALGGWAGAKYVMKKGNKWARLFFILIATLIALNLLIQM